VGAVKTLEAGGSSVLITRQEARIRPVPFSEIVDPKTGRTRVRGVDVESDSYRNALALQERVFQSDLDDARILASLAAAAKLSPEAAKQRYAPL
jgi:6-phosphofructokinase 1